MGVSREGEAKREFAPCLEIGIKNQIFREKPEVGILIPINWFDSCNHRLFAGVTLILHKSQVHCSDVMQWWPCGSLMSSGVRRKVSWGEFWFKVIWWSFGVRFLWRHNLTSFSCFQTNVLAKFVDIICIFLYIHSPYFMYHCTEYKLSTLQVRLSEKNKLNAMTQQFITAKISGCVLKKGSETHSSLRQSNLQLQNQATLRSRQIRAVAYWRYAAGLAGAHPGLQDGILLNYTRIANAHKVRKKTFVLCDYKSPQACDQGGGTSPKKIFAYPGKMCWTYFETIGRSLKNLSPSQKTFLPPRYPKLVTGLDVQQKFSFPFSLLRHYQMPECFYVNDCGFWARVTVLSFYRNC